MARSKPSTCKCGSGGFRNWGRRWRVIKRRRRPDTSQLKCLACGWKWWSRCLYADRLADHFERSRSGMTDDGILARLNDGTLVVGSMDAAVDSLTYQGWTRLKQIERESNGSTYRFVAICRHGKKKNIALHRLVWMSVYRRLVPDGFDVDHIEGKDGRWPDRFTNLRLRLAGDNRSVDAADYDGAF